MFSSLFSRAAIITFLMTSLASYSSAAPITHSYKTISSQSEVIRNDHLQSWNILDTEVTTNFTTFDKQRTGGKRLNRLSIDLSFGTGSGLFNFRAGLDAGLGASIFLNGNSIAHRADDLWWRYNWGNSDVIETGAFLLNSGQNLLDIYWGEWCCNGGNSMMFSFGNSNWLQLNEENLSANFQQLPKQSLTSVPEPSTVLLLTLGLAGLAACRRIKL